MIKQTLAELLEFIKNPTDTQKPSSFWGRLQIIFILLGLNLLFNIFIVFPIYEGVEYFIDLNNTTISSKKKLSPLYALFLVAVLAPIWEELIFRGFLRKNKWKWINIHT